MRAIILAAGDGTRLGMNIPKALLKIDGKTILEHQVDGLRDNGIEDIYVVIGYKAELFPSIGIKYIYNSRYLSENSYSLFLALREARGDSLAVIDGDVMYDYRILGMLRDANVCLIDTSQVWKDGDVGVQYRDNWVTHVGKGYRYGVAIGIDTFTSEFADNFYRHLYSRDFREPWVVYLDEIINVSGFETAYVGLKWKEIDTEEDYKNALFLFDDPKLELTGYATMQEIWSMYKAMGEDYEGLHLSHRNSQRDIIAWNNSRVFAVRLNGRVIGLVRYVSDGAYYIALYDGMVRPEYQNKKIGTQMYNFLLREAKRENPLKIHFFGTAGEKYDHFFQKLGFKLARSKAYEIRYE